MKIINNLCLILAILVSIASCNKKDNISEYSVYNNNEILSRFKIVIWDNKEIPDFEKINILKLNDLEKKYKILITFSDKNIISYYWDAQVFKVKTDSISYKKMFVMDLLSTNYEFFSIIIDNKIIYNGIVLKESPRVKIISNVPMLVLPPYSYEYGKNISTLILKPLSYTGKMYFKDFNDEEKRIILIPELYDYFDKQNKIVKGEFPFEEARRRDTKE